MNSFGRALAGLALAGLAGAIAAPVAFAAGPAPKPPLAQIEKTRGGTWASIATLPKMSGVWETTRGAALAAAAPNLPPVRNDPPALTPPYAAKAAAFKAEEAAKAAKGETLDVDTANCVPPGMPDVMTQPYPIEMLFTPGKVTIAVEAYSQMRRIFTDGRPHGSPDQTFNGHSIGHWEGDELVVDTVGFDPQTRLTRDVGHSDLMHIVERFKLVNDEVLRITTTIDDAQALLSPWTKVAYYKRHADWDIAEYVCEQNNRNLIDSSGKAGVVLKQ